MEWWKTTDIASSFANSVKAQADRAIDSYTKKVQEMTSFNQKNEALARQAAGKRTHCIMMNKRADLARERIKAANQKLLEYGFSDQIPINEYTITQEMQGGYASSIFSNALTETATARRESEEKELRKAAEHDVKLSTPNWNKLTYQAQQDLIQQNYQAKVKALYPEGRYSLTDPRSFSNQYSVDKLVEGGYMESPEIKDFSKWYPGAVISEQGADMGGGFTLMPDYSVVSNNQTVGWIHPQTGDFMKKEPIPEYRGDLTAGQELIGGIDKLLGRKPSAPMGSIQEAEEAGHTEYQYDPSSMGGFLEGLEAMPKPETFTIYPHDLGITTGGGSETYTYNVTSEEQARQILTDINQRDIDAGREATPRWYKYNPETQVATIGTSSQRTLDSGVNLTFGYNSDGGIVVYAGGKKIGGVNLETNEFDDATIQYLVSHFRTAAYEADPQYAMGYKELDVPVVGTIINFLTKKRIDSETGAVAPAIVEILGVMGLVGTVAYMVQAGVTALYQIINTPLKQLLSPLPVPQRVGEFRLGAEIPRVLPSRITGLPKPGQIVVPGDKGKLQTILFDPKTGQPIPVYDAPKPRYLTIAELKIWKAFQQTSGYQEIYDAYLAGRLGEVGGKQALGSFNAITGELGRAYLYEQQAIKIGEQITNAEAALAHLQSTGQTQMALRKAQDIAALRQALQEAQLGSKNIHLGLQTLLNWRLKGEHPDINRIAGLLTSGAQPATTTPVTPTTPPAQAGGALATQVTGTPPTVPPITGVTAGATGLAPGIPMPLEVQQQLLAQGEVLLQQVPEVLPNHLHTIGIPEGEAFVRTDAQGKPLIVGESYLREGQLTLGNIVAREKGAVKALIDVGKYIKENNIAFPPREEMSPDAIRIYDRLQGEAKTTTQVEAVKPTATTVKITAIPTKGKIIPETETTALAEGGTVTGEAFEGTVEVTGLEPVRAIRNLQSQYASQKIKYDAAKKELVAYVNKHLPLEARGKMLASVKNVKTEAGLKKAMVLADKYAERAAQKTLRAQIIKELKQTAPKKVRGVVRGKYGAGTADVQKQLDAIRANTNTDRAVVQEKILENIRAYEEGELDYDAMLSSNELLNVSGLKGMSSDEMVNTLRYIKTLKETGKTVREASRKEIDELIPILRDVITGGKGAKVGVGSIPSSELEPQEKLGKVWNWQYAWDNYLDKLSKYDKGSEQYQSALSVFGSSVHIASGLDALGRQEILDKIITKYREIYGVSKTKELNPILNNQGSEKVNVGTFKNAAGEEVTLSLTKQQLIQKYMELQDPTLEKTFTENMKWTDEMITAVKDSLTDAEVARAEWQLGFLAGEYYDTINGVFRSVYGVDLGYNSNYTPINRDVDSTTKESLLVARDMFRYASVNNPSLKARVRSSAPLKFTDADAVLLKHIEEMEHFKAWASTIRDLRRVFMNKEIRAAIRQYHGRDILKHIDKNINDMARGGIERVRLNRQVDYLIRAFTRSVLAKPAIGLRQIPSVFAYSTEMPIRDYFEGIADFWKDPLAHTRKLTSKSAYLKARFTLGHERDIRFAMKKGYAKQLSNKNNWQDYPMILIRLGDKLAVTQGSWAAYLSAIKAGKSENQAILFAEMATKRTQPSFGLEDMAGLRREGSWVRLLTMFQSQPNKYFRIVADNMRNFQYGRGSRPKHAYNIFLAWAVLPMLFQYMVDGFQFKEKHQLRAGLLGPMNFILIAGQLIQYLYGWLSDEPFDYSPSPVVSSIDELQRGVTGLVNIIKAGQDPTEEIDLDYLASMIEHFSKAGGQLTGVPTPYAIMVERAIRNADIRQLVFSEYTLKSEDDAIRKLQDIYAQAWGYNNWKDMPEGNANTAGTRAHFNSLNS